MYEITRYITDWRILDQLSQVNTKWRKAINNVNRDSEIWKPIFTAKYPLHLHPVRETWKESVRAWSLRLCVGCNRRSMRQRYFQLTDFFCDDCIKYHPLYGRITPSKAMTEYGLEWQDIEDLSSDEVTLPQYYLRMQVIAYCESQPGGLEGYLERKRKREEELAAEYKAAREAVERGRARLIEVKEENRNKRRQRLVEEAAKHSLEVPEELTLVQTYIKSRRPALGSVIESIRRKIQVEGELDTRRLPRERYYDDFVDYINLESDTFLIIS